MVAGDAVPNKHLVCTTHTCIIPHCYGTAVKYGRCAVHQNSDKPPRVFVMPWKYHGDEDALAAQCEQQSIENFSE